jgi:hypothetical protein
MPVKRHVIFTSSEAIPSGYVAVENPALVERARVAYERMKTLIDMGDDELAAAIRVPVAEARIALLAQLSAYGPGGDDRGVAVFRAVPDPGVGWNAEVLL